LIMCLSAKICGNGFDFCSHIKNNVERTFRFAPFSCKKVESSVLEY